MIRFYIWELITPDNQILTSSSFIGKPQTYQTNQSTRYQANKVQFVAAIL